VNKRIPLEIAIPRYNHRGLFANILRVSQNSGPGYAALFVAIPTATFVIDIMINDTGLKFNVSAANNARQVNYYKMCSQHET
jgi:hypothetical protein